jgi:hypothetical protein
VRSLPVAPGAAAGEKPGSLVNPAADSALPNGSDTKAGPEHSATARLSFLITAWCGGGPSGGRRGQQGLRAGAGARERQ